MNTFLLSFDANTTITGSLPPTLEVLIGGVVVSSLEMESGPTSYDVFIDFTGAAPSSVTLRFAGSSGSAGDSISFTAAAINNTALNVATDLTATLLTQSQTSGVTASNNIYGHTPPTIGAPTITGTTGNDENLIGDDTTADIIDGLAGNDRILGYGNDDAINGGDGDDYIFGQSGADTILGGAGNDILYGNEDNDILFGEADNDYLIGGAGDDVLNGGSGNDGLIGDAGNDVIFGEDGDDWLIGDAGDDILFGDDGNDVIIGGADNDALSGGAGTDQLIGGAGDDLMSGGDDADELIGEDGIDTIDGDAGDDVIIAGAGDDIVDGGADNDTIQGGDGADALDGGSGNDVLFGDNDAIDVGLNVAGMVSYGGSQDVGGTFSDITGGVLLDGNLWKKIQVDYTVTANTVISFDFMSTNEAEISGIGFDNDDTIDPNATFKVYGDQSWGRTNYEDYDGSGEWMHFEINVGSFYTGTFSHLFLVNDDDGGPDEGDGSWRNLTISEIGSDNNDTMDGGAGDDRLYGHGGIDTLSGSEGDDIIYGGSGADVIDGGEDNDTLYGEAGNNTLYGGAGNDSIFGGANNDTIYGDGTSEATIMEAGRTSVTQANSTEWHSVSFAGTIENAVVKMFAEDIALDPFTIRVRNITNSGFEFQLDEYDYQDGATVSENISWIAVASGSHTLSNGLKIQAGFTTATNETASSVAFNSSLTAPVVFTQVSSDNELSAVVTRNNNVTTTGFDVQMQEEEANANIHATEDIGWIAIESGGSVGDGILVGTTGNVVTHATTTLNYGGTFGATPAIIADMQTLDGGDTAVAAGASSHTTSQANLYIDEEASNDGETSHTTEDVGYIVLEEGIYTAQTTVNGSDTLFGGDGDDVIYADLVEDTSVLDGSAANPLGTAILNDAPVGYWNLDETSGTTADNLGSVGSAVDGTINGGATLGSATLYSGGGTAIDFDGINDGILIPDDASINTSTYTEKTVELVFNADNVTTRQVLYEEGGQTHGFTIYLDGGNIYVTGEEDGVWVDANINAAVSTGTTYHVAFVFDQPNNSFEGFLDGVSMGSVTVGSSVFPAHSGDIGIGYAPDGVQFHDGDTGGGYNFNGRISDVAIYTRALSSGEILEHADIVSGSLPAAGTVDDTLYGGDGFDQLYGGEGRDVFVFKAASAFNDVDEINGFNVGEQDAIDISDILTGYTAGVSDINDFVQLSVAAGNTTISIDANGASGGANFTDIVTINNFSGASVDMLLTNHSIIPV